MLKIEKCINRFWCSYEFTLLSIYPLTHWGWVMHICVSKLIIIGSDNGLSPGWRQAIIWNNARILLIGPPGTNFNKILIEILIEIYTCTWKCLEKEAIWSLPQCVDSVNSCMPLCHTLKTKILSCCQICCHWWLMTKLALWQLSVFKVGIVTTLSFLCHFTHIA